MFKKHSWKKMPDPVMQTVGNRRETVFKSSHKIGTVDQFHFLIFAKLFRPNW